MDGLGINGKKSRGLDKVQVDLRAFSDRRSKVIRAKELQNTNCGAVGEAHAR